MGRGTIISHQGGGRYSVNVRYDRTGIDAAISDLEDLIAACQNVIDDPASTETQVLYAKARKLGAQKRINYLSDPDKVPDDETVSAWCADLTTDLSGDVGTIEIGREPANGLLIQPGYNDNAVYDADRDGQLMSTMAVKPLANFINLGFLPGMQKWLPAYRTGTITDINYAADTCDIALAGISSSQQELGINQADTLSDVPVNYMGCNAAAFSIGDAVLVEFANYDWSSPKVTGFQSHPKPCDAGFILIVSTESGTEAFAWDILDDSLLVSKASLTSVKSSLAGLGFPVATEAQPSGTESDEWNDYLYPTYDAVRNLPTLLKGGLYYLDWDESSVAGSGSFDPANYFYMNYDGTVEDDWTLTFSDDTNFSVSGASAGSVGSGDINHDFNPTDGDGNEYFELDYRGWSGSFQAGDVITWTTYFAADGLKTVYTPVYPHSYESYGPGGIWSFDLNYMENPEDGSESDKAAYIIMLEGQARDSEETAFETATGVTWPATGAPLRQYLYFHSMFDYPMDGVPAYLDNLEATMTQLADSWNDATWTDADTVSIITAWLVSGIASNSAGHIMFESAGVCFDRDAATDECNDYNNDYDRIFRVYEKPKADTVMSGLALDCFNAVNSERTSRGLSALAPSTALVEAAERHAEDLTDNFDYEDYSHTGSDGTSPYDRINDTEYFLHWYDQGYSVGENIGWNDDPDPVAKAVENWEDSTEHWNMILNEDMVESGVAAITKADGVTTFVQVFGYRQYIWPGFTPIDTSDLLTYIDNNFEWSSEDDYSRTLKTFLA